MTHFDLFVLVWLVTGVVMLPVLMFRTAPYGRYAASGSGPMLPSWLGWLVMEAPSVVVFTAALFWRGMPGTTQLALFALWQIHYVHRAFIYPFRLRTPLRPMPFAIAGSALFFTTVNGFINGYALSVHDYGPEGWRSPAVIVGAAVFFVGFAINQHADWVLLHLRAPGETGYKIPYGGLYRWISCPNYFGEIIEWCGFAIASRTLASVAFAVWTVANLFPRALAHHRWYRERFPEYPKERKAVVPGVV